MTSDRRKFLLAACVAILGYAAIHSGSYAADDPGQHGRYATLNCEQLRVEFFKVEHSLLVDKSGATMPGTGSSAPAKPQPTGMTPREIDRSTAMANALAGLDLLSRLYIAKRCDARDVDKTAGLAPAGEISMFAPAADIATGQRDYKNRCAMCHGVDGKGDGWFARYLTERPPALTRLKQSAGGVFPLAHLYDTIDGRQEVAMHGPREMPVWGASYRSAASHAYESQVGEPAQPEGGVRARIYALLKYIYQFQE